MSSYGTVVFALISKHLLHGSAYQEIRTWSGLATIYTSWAATRVSRVHLKDHQS